MPGNAGGKLELEEGLAIMARVAEGLQSLHNRGIVHLDIKPQNIVFDSYGCAVVTNLTTAREYPAAIGAFHGTPAYL
jgi:serine/threonine protein kinase